MTPASLHGKPRHPYYICAPDYRETSSGVCVLHYLCHALNLAGHEAYVTHCKVNPALRTPILTDEIRLRHMALGLAPIAVYPEVADGNPIGAPIVARYILNREGFLTGRAIDARESDLFFYYTQDFRGNAKSDDLLLLPVIDSELFSPPAEPIERRGHYLYLNRFDKTKVDYSLLPDDIEVLSLANPKTLAQLAQIFRQASVLYSYEISATCTEAMLCGCPVIYMPGGHVTAQPFVEQFGNAGSALYHEPGGLERARASVMQARMRWLDIERAFWPQLQRFIDTTQRAAVRHVVQSQVPSVRDWLLQRQLTPVQQQLTDARRQQLSGLTSLTLLVRDEKGDAAALQDTLDSIAWWRTSSSIRLSTVVLSTRTAPPALAAGVRWLHCTAPGALELNEALQREDSDWMMLLDAGDEILPSGALMLDLELAGAEGCRMLYCDGMFRSAEGPGAVLRPGVNLDYLLSLPLAMASHWLVRRTLALQVGGYDPSLPRALELDLTLRLIEQDGLAGIAHLDEAFIVSNTPLIEDNADERNAISRHLANRGYVNAQVLESPARHYHIKYGHAQQPLVSIVIPTRDNLALLQRCVESLLEKTGYPHFEIILVDNDSQDQQTHDWLNNMAMIGQDRLSVLRYPGPFNFSAINNFAAGQARGEYLVLMNNDVAVLDEHWLDELLNHAQRPEVGAVGAKLLTPAGRIQHAGLIGGLHGPAGSPSLDQPANASGYLQRLHVDQSMSAVSASCLMVDKALYLAANGMDEEHFQVTCNDLDFCLKLVEMGYLNVWTPHATLVHEGGASWAQVRKLPQMSERFAQDQHNAYAKWLPQLANDPAHNRHLSLHGSGFEFERLMELSWRPLCWRPLPVVLACPSQDEHAAAQLQAAFNNLRDAGQIDGCVSDRLLSPVEVQRLRPDVIVLQHACDARRLPRLSQMLGLSSAFKILQVTALPNTAAERDTLEQAARMVDRIVVCSQALANNLEGLHDDIQVIDNRLDGQWADLPRPVRLEGKPRLGCAFLDNDPATAELAEQVVRHWASRVDWVLWGDVPAHLQQHARELHPAQVQHSPRLLASLNLDAALLIRSDSTQAAYDDALALMQLGACGYAVACSDVATLPASLCVTRAVNEVSAWNDAITALVDDEPTRNHQGAALRAQVGQAAMADAAYLQRLAAAWLPG
ncbi:glycosyltransferase family 2 protein [Pseudomonas asiatica]|uniref:glycosyltransferase family 2 protein n=1 Tax=Pseudomonas asiatica TaxID=2219225 RepID=UPI00383B0FA4